MMKIGGLLLIALSFIAGSYLAVLDTDFMIDQNTLNHLTSFKITPQTLDTLRQSGVPENHLNKLTALTGTEITGKATFLNSLKKYLGEKQSLKYQALFLKHSQNSRLKSSKNSESLLQKLASLKGRIIQGKPAYTALLKATIGEELFKEKENLILQYTHLSSKKVSWGYLLPVLLLGALGVVLVRVDHHKSAQAEDRIANNISAIKTSMNNIIEKVTQLDSDKKNIHTYKMGKKIDQLLLDDLNTFVEARETIGHVYGLQAYANVMNHYACGERYLNRVWAASADGYIDEVNEYIQRAKIQFVEAHKQLQALEV